MAALPDGWVACRDAMGRIFFANKQTQQTTFEDPRPLPPGWVVARLQTGQLVFANQQTQQTQWQDPRGDPVISVDMTQQQQQLATYNPYSQPGQQQTTGVQQNPYAAPYGMQQPAQPVSYVPPVQQAGYVAQPQASEAPPSYDEYYGPGANSASPVVQPQPAQPQEQYPKPSDFAHKQDSGGAVQLSPANFYNNNQPQTQQPSSPSFQLSAPLAPGELPPAHYYPSQGWVLIWWFPWFFVPPLGMWINAIVQTGGAEQCSHPMMTASTVVMWVGFPLLWGTLHLFFGCKSRHRATMMAEGRITARWLHLGGVIAAIAIASYALNLYDQELCHYRSGSSPPPGCCAYSYDYTCTSSRNHGSSTCSSQSWSSAPAARAEMLAVLGTSIFLLAPAIIVFFGPAGVRCLKKNQKATTQSEYLT